MWRESDSDDEQTAAEDENNLLSKCRSGQTPPLSELQDIVQGSRFDRNDVPRCVGCCLEDGNAEAAQFLIDHFHLNVNETVPLQVSPGARGVQHTPMLSIAVFERECAAMLLKYPELDVGIFITHVTTKFTVAGLLVRILLLPTGGSGEKEQVPLRMLLERQNADLSEVWAVLFRYGTQGNKFSSVSRNFFPLLRFLRDHPKTAPLLNQPSACVSERKSCANGQDNTGADFFPFFQHLAPLCVAGQRNGWPDPPTLITILQELPLLSMGGHDASGRSALHVTWRLGPDMVAQILRYPDVDVDQADERGETVLALAREQAYTTADPLTCQTVQLLQQAGAHCPDPDMITVTLPASPGSSCAVRASDLCLISKAAHTFLQTEYRTAAETERSATCRSEFALEELSKAAFERVLDALVWRRMDPGGQGSKPRRQWLIQESVFHSSQEQTLFRELVAAADAYLMTPVQHLLATQVEAWLAAHDGQERAAHLASLLHPHLLNSLFPSERFEGKLCPGAVRQRLASGLMWEAAEAMGAIRRARACEPGKLEGGSWECSGDGLRIVVTFGPQGACEVAGRPKTYRVMTSSLSEEGRVHVEGAGEFVVERRDESWAPILVQRRAGGGQYVLTRRPEQ